MRREIEFQIGTVAKLAWTVDLHKCFQMSAELRTQFGVRRALVQGEFTKAVSKAAATMKANGRKSQDLLQAESGSLATVANRIDGGMPHFDNGQRETRVEAEVVLKPSEVGRQCEAMGSSCGDSKGRVPEMARPLRLQCSACEDLLHELSNVITGVLMNAQVLEWKLPPYSHLKRSVREVERNAQRGSELLKRLLRLVRVEGKIGSVDGADDEIESAPTYKSAELTRKRIGDISSDLTGDCDPRTSGVFPKRDDGDKR